MPRRQDNTPDDIHRLDLSQLDLDHIQLDDLTADARPSSVGGRGRLRQIVRWLVLVALVAAGATLLWLPETEYYRRQGEARGLFFVVCGIAVPLGVLAARWLWEWAEEAAASYASRYALRHPYSAARPPRPPSTLARWAAFLLAAGGAVAIVVGAPSEGGYLSGGGSGYPVAWFWAAGGAVAVGILGGRWIIMHALRPGRAPRVARPHAPAPPWIKWVTLSVLVLGGLVTAFGANLIGGVDERTLGFALGGAGFVIGVLGAIWLARRFDEAEEKIRQAARERRRQG